MAAAWLAAALILPTAAEAQARGDEAGTLKGARGAPKPGASKAKPGVGSQLMEEEGIFYFIRKPAGRDQPKSR